MASSSSLGEPDRNSSSLPEHSPDSKTFLCIDYQVIPGLIKYPASESPYLAPSGGPSRLVLRERETVRHIESELYHWHGITHLTFGGGGGDDPLPMSST